jgi:hypothetical protein
MYWAVSVALTGSGYLLAVLFGQHNAFVYDPSPENWRRRTDPQNQIDTTKTGPLK